LTGVVLTSAACESEDIGKACDDGAPGSVGEEPIGGERPLVEVVRISRDGACESFQCLRHQGLDPYCTRECEILPTETETPCATDDECAGEATCAEDGICREDDCPTGFACRHVQEAGPLRDLTFCVRRVRCEQSVDCGALGEIDCIEHACYDGCDKLTELEDCDFHQLVCEPLDTFTDEVVCDCEGGEPDLSCADAQLRCSLPSSSVPWERPPTRIGVCLSKTSVQ
jgi:hypothetical protein